MCSEASVEKVMDYCLKDLPFTYVITDNIIVIKEKEASRPEDKILYAINGVITGKDSTPLWRRTGNAQRNQSAQHKQMPPATFW